VFLDARLGEARFNPGTTPSAPREANTFQSTFAGISFLGEGILEHEVRLEPLEDQWHRTQTREARYPALGPGAYTFRVRSRVGTGAWGPEAQLQFKILPSWWQTGWFRTLMVLGLVGIIVETVRWRMKALHRKNRELEALVHARTKELEVANEALRAQSLTDPLTGLKNRRYLGVCMPEDVAQVQRTHHSANRSQAERLLMNIDLIFIMVDVDHFKSINDQFGHHAGDLVLQQLAEILRGATRDTDTVVRWGGEEFLVVARNACRKEAVILVERIRALVEAHAFDIGDGKVLHRTCSLGFAFFPFLPAKPDFLAWEMVVDVADHGLYAAKRAGRNGWVGLMPGLEESPEAFHGAFLFRIPDLTTHGHLAVLSSFAEGTVFEWDLKG
jgi:diguanylate cyclase (GGDEF)-like protein